LHGGSVEASNLAEGGLLVRIRIPLAKLGDRMIGPSDDSKTTPVIAGDK